MSFNSTDGRYIAICDQNFCTEIYMSIHIHTPRESTGRDDRKMLRLNNTREERRIDKES